MIDKQKVEKWDSFKLNGTKYLNILDTAYDGFFNKRGVIYSEHLMFLILAEAKNDGLKHLVEKIHSIEKNCRNHAAHEIMSVTDTVIKERTGFTGIQIMKMVQQLFDYTGLKTSSESWNSYDDMNDMIIRLLDE